MNLKQLALSADGRIGRATFLAALAGLLAANFLVQLVPLVGPVLVLPLLWPFACVTAKRLHDGGRSGWPAAAVAGLCLATGAVAAAMGLMATDPALALSAFAAAGAVLVLGTAAMLAAVALIVWALLLDAEPGRNRFGEPAAAASPLRAGS